MNTWDVSVTLDIPAPGGDGLAAVVAATPCCTGAGRAPHGGHLLVAATLHAADSERAGAVATALARHAAQAAGLRDDDGDVRVLAVEVLDAGYSERLSQVEHRLDLVGVPTAAGILGISQQAVRLRCSADPLLDATKVDGAWIMRRATVEALARARRTRPL